MYPNLKIVPWVAAVLALSGTVQAPHPAAPAPLRATLERAYQANNTGVAWLERFEYGKATAAFREALSLQPSLGIAHFNLALALLYDGKLDDAGAEARAAAAAMRGSPAPDYVAGLIANAQGRTAAAVQAFARAAQADPQDAAAHILLGQMRLQQGDAAGAVATLRTALELEPYSATAAYNLSIALSRSGRTDESRQMLLRFQTLRERGGTTLGAGYLEQGRHAQGIVSTGAEPDLVDRAVPDVRFVAAAPLGSSARPTPERPSPVGHRYELRELDVHGQREIAASAGAAIALFDADNDGDLDLIDAGTEGLRLWRNSAGRFVPAPASGLARPAGATVPTAVVAGDYNNDGRADLLVAGHGGPSLYRNRGGGAFVDVTASSHLRAGSSELPLTAAFIDIDHDGDLDIVLPGYVDLAPDRSTRELAFPDEFAAAPTRVWRNNGDGTFADVTTASGITAGRATAIVPTDYDERRDVDLLIASDTGRLALFTNLRDGSFRDVTKDAGLTATGRLAALAAGDLNRDGRTDFLIARGDGASSLALSAAYAKFRMDAAPAGATGATAAQTIDYDNDGLTDLLVVSNQRLRLLRSLGDAWQDVTDRALGSAAKDAILPPLASGRAVAIGDVDGDGDDDIVIRTNRGVQVLRNDGGNRQGALRLRLAARVSNRSAIGSRIEMRAGSLHVRRETYASTPAPAPADLVLGLGGRTAVDAVRIQWPAGIVQAELQPALDKPLTITELDRKPSSCPYLFTWNGTQFEFLTDFLGGGELGYWLAPGVRNEADPDEYVRIPADALHVKNGRYELRVTNELEEVLYLDHLHLEAVAHPTGVEVYPNEGLLSPPYPAAALYALRHRRPLTAAVDEHGHDVTAALASVDRTYPDDFALREIRGYSASHMLTLRLDAGVNDALLLTGWTDYAFSSDNVAASQHGLQMSPPSLQVRDPHGAWRTVVADIGIPIGRPQTIVVDLRQPALRGRRDLRIVTNMRIYWDAIASAAIDGEVAPVRTRLDAASAMLRWRGFSAELSPDGREPFAYDYNAVSASSPWKTMPGGYSAEGDVRTTLSAVDDRFVVMRPGDEAALEFDATRLPPIPPGWTRTFLLYGVGFSKEMDLNSASPDQVEPLPFHGMRSYPPEHAESSRGARVLRPRPPGLPRRVVTSLPSIDSLLLDAQKAMRPRRPSSSR